MAHKKWASVTSFALAGVIGGFSFNSWAQNPETAPRLIRILDDGEKVSCRVLHTWYQPDGQVCHFTQIQETGEMATLVQDGKPYTVQGAQGPKLQVPLRVVHWGQGVRTPPEGSPTPPDVKVEVRQKMPTGPGLEPAPLPKMTQGTGMPLAPAPKVTEGTPEITQTNSPLPEPKISSSMHNFMP